MTDFSKDERAAAARVLEWYGGDSRRWVQGTYAYVPDGSDAPSAKCVSGACGVRDHHWLTVALGRILPPNAVSPLTGEPYFSIVEWNDTPGRTFLEIEAALKQVAGEP